MGWKPLRRITIWLSVPCTKIQWKCCPKAFLQACFATVAAGLAGWRLRSCTEPQMNLAVAWMQFTASRSRPLPCAVLLKVRIVPSKKPPMRESGSQIQLWLIPSGRAPSKVTGTVPATALSSHQERVSHSHPGALDHTEVSPPKLTSFAMCVTWAVWPTLSDSNSTISDSYPHLPSNMTGSLRDISETNITFVTACRRKWGLMAFNQTAEPWHHLSGILILSTWRGAQESGPKQAPQVILIQLKGPQCEKQLREAEMMSWLGDIFSTKHRKPLLQAKTP